MQGLPGDGVVATVPGVVAERSAPAFGGRPPGHKARPAAPPHPAAAGAPGPPPPPGGSLDQ
ncbi:hypothetical protein, partial [Nocardia cyriacigeorgica]|uniref:hypothetical protein n=1 Tax=Nocardia cyriacigeorgica TaxID=135487 RepID=UPI0024563567